MATIGHELGPAAGQIVTRVVAGTGGGLAKNSPNKEAGIKFLEYLASDSAQLYFANGNNEWPAVTSVKVSNPALETMGTFKVDPLPIAQAGAAQAQVQQMLDRVGYK